MKLNTEKIKRQFEENPIAFMAVGAALLVGASRFIDAAGGMIGSRAYAKQVNYRVKNRK